MEDYMDFNYQASIIMIVKEEEKLEQIKQLFDDGFEAPLETDRITEKNDWFICPAKLACEYMPSSDPDAWKPVMKKISQLLGQDGAVIANVTDELFAEAKGNEIQECEHISSTPKGKMLDYETLEPDEFYDDDEGADIPQGFEKFKKAFIKAYGANGKEMMVIYDDMWLKL